MNGGVAPISMEGYLDLFDTNAESILRDIYPENGNLMHTMILGDVSPAMLWDQTFWKEMQENHGRKEPMVLVPHLIRNVLPDAKFIIILRNPTDRLYSDWLFFEQDHKTPQRFDEQVRFAIFWFNNCTKYLPIRTCFYNPIDRSPYHSDSFREANPWWHPAFRLRIGLYYIFIADLLSVFPKKQVMIMRLEDYSLNRLHWMKKVFEFLDLEHDPDFEAKLKKSDIVNTNVEGYNDYGNIYPNTQLLLDNFYKPFNIKLASLLQDHAFDWKR
jgi:N-acetylgalactosamine 4-sulfate 6-O-sulfotransferase